MRLGIAESYDDQVELRADQNPLAEGAATIEQPEAAGDDPEVGAVSALGLRRRRAGVIDPTCGQDAFTVPHPVAQIQIAEASKVTGAAVTKRRADEVAGEIESPGT